MSRTSLHKILFRSAGSSGSSGSEPHPGFGVSASGSFDRSSIGQISYENETNGSGSDHFFRNISHTDVTYGQKQKQLKMVNQYVLGDMVGQGSYGKVKEAFDTLRFKRVAIKILKKRHWKRIPRGAENVRREISIMNALKPHSNVVGLNEVIYNKDKEVIYLVIEFVEGGSLQDLLDGHGTDGLPLSQAQMYFKQVVSAVDSIHSQGIIHRDIKPGNLMLTHHGQIKLSDFGVAETLDMHDDGAIASTMGTPAFQPPEIAKGGKSESGAKIDVWAMGVTLYYLLTGKPPFESESLFHLFQSISDGDFRIPESLASHPTSVDLLKGMLNVDGHERFSIEDIKNHPWMHEEFGSPSDAFVRLPSSGNLAQNVMLKRTPHRGSKPTAASPGDRPKLFNTEESDSDFVDDCESPVLRRHPGLHPGAGVGGTGVGQGPGPPRSGVPSSSTLQGAGDRTDTFAHAEPPPGVIRLRDIVAQTDGVGDGVPVRVAQGTGNPSTAGRPLNNKPPVYPISGGQAGPKGSVEVYRFESRPMDPQLSPPTSPPQDLAQPESVAPPRTPPAKGARQAGEGQAQGSGRCCVVL